MRFDRGRSNFKLLGSVPRAGLRPIQGGEWPQDRVEVGAGLELGWKVREGGTLFFSGIFVVSKE